MKKDKEFYRNKIKKMYKCEYCGFYSNDLNEIKKHEEFLHCHFRDKNPRKRKSSKRTFEPKEDGFVRRNYNRIDVIYRWDNTYNKYRLFVDCLKYRPGEEVELLDNGFGGYIVKDLDEMQKEWNKTHVDKVKVTNDENESFNEFKGVNLI